MLLKFFNHGKGSISTAINYLINAGDIENKKVIRGNSSLTQSIANSINCTNIYKSGVLSFEESDISVDTKEDIMNLFENTIFAGIDADDKNILWVQHKDKDRLELHFLIPRVHLGTHKAFNPYYHDIDLERVDTFKNYVNLKYDLTNPNDPQKSRTYSYNNNPKLNLSEKIEKDELVKELYIAVGDGVINNREELIASLKTAGYTIRRTGKEYISVKTDDMKKAMRFKGGIFSETFTGTKELERAYQEKVTVYQQRGSQNLPTRLTELKEELDRLNQAKSIYNQKRYKSDNYQNSNTLNNTKLSIGNSSDASHQQDDNRNLHKVADTTKTETTDRKSILSSDTRINTQSKSWRDTTLRTKQGLTHEQEADSYNNIIERIRISRAERKSAYTTASKTRRSIFEQTRKARNSSYSEFRKSREAVCAEFAGDIGKRQNEIIKNTSGFIGDATARIEKLIIGVKPKTKNSVSFGGVKCP